MAEYFCDVCGGEIWLGDKIVINGVTRHSISSLICEEKLKARAIAAEQDRDGFRESGKGWHQAALRIGEELASVGPDGYYGMGPERWQSWALAAIAALQAENAMLQAQLYAAQPAIDAMNGTIWANCAGGTWKVEPGDWWPEGDTEHLPYIDDGLLWEWNGEQYQGREYQ